MELGHLVRLFSHGFRVLGVREILLDPDKNYFGFGDVLGVPLAVTISQVFMPILGLAAFAFGVMLVSWKFPGRKQLRLLPWLIPGVLLAFLTALVL